MRKFIFIALSLFIAAGAFAADFRDFYVIPVAAHAPGANGTSWRTDVFIQNIQSVPVTVDFALVEAGEGLTDNIQPVAVGTAGASTLTVPAGGSMALTDILNNYRGRAQSSGALLLGGDHAFAVTSRTYNSTVNGTMGQTVTASPDVASDGSDAASTLFIPGLVANRSFRSNIGLFMAATTPMTVTVTINGADGHAAGTRTFNVGAGATTQVQFGSGSVTSAPFDSAGAVVQITGGTGTVIAYASIVDDFTGDASFVSGGTAAAGAVQPLSMLLAKAVR